MSSDDKEMSPVDASPETNSAKRKADVEEIEVDLAAPEPPSKRARRAMKKSKSATLKAKKDNDNNDLEEEETTNKDKKDDKAARSEHGVWIGNLRFTVTPQELRQWLIDNSGGVLTSDMITRVKLPLSKTPGRDKSEPATNKGFAYVDFSDIGGKVAAVALSETEWHGRRLLIKDSTSFEGRPKKEPEAKEDGPADRKGGAKKPAVDPNASRKIFVGNMSFKTTEDDLRRNFEKCGEIEWAKIATFEDTGKCKGYGWVKFKEAEAAAWAWYVNRMLGRELKLELAEDDQSRYRKRFGKDRPANAAGRRGPREDGGDGRRHEHKKAETAEDIQTARLMGRVVEHTGSKVTFD
ncbi:Nucleolar protein 13 [Beauveria bassiana]|uniref:Nucleolar protein 13 n=1 Tax=Beauveria bassiana TaxID=176275 RepID=A0A2N6NYR7_BEABA|nr:Nucleolar protein 13 [Beauveria bassiana]